MVLYVNDFQRLIGLIKFTIYIKDISDILLKGILLYNVYIRVVFVSIITDPYLLFLLTNKKFLFSLQLKLANLEVNSSGAVN